MDDDQFVQDLINEDNFLRGMAPQSTPQRTNPPDQNQSTGNPQDGPRSRTRTRIRTRTTTTTSEAPQAQIQTSKAPFGQGDDGGNVQGKYPTGKKNWPMKRRYHWSFDEKDSDGFPSQHTILNDWLVWRICKSSEKKKRFNRWPMNFQDKEYIDWKLNGIGRAAKILQNGVWKYAVMCEMKLHDQKGQKANKERKTENRSISVNETTETDAVHQANIIKSENGIYSKTSVTASVRFWNGKKQDTPQSTIQPIQPQTIVQTSITHDLIQIHQTPPDDSVQINIH